MKRLSPLVSAFLMLVSYSASLAPAHAAEKKITVGFLPKSTGNSYFLSCQDGARLAAKELNVELLTDGPVNSDPAKQREIVERWIALGVDAIAAACDGQTGISQTLKKAQSKGIKVITYDADSLPGSRTFFVNQATSESIGTALMNDAAQLCGNEGEYAIIAENLTAANELEWRKYIEARNRTAFPGMKLVAIRACDNNIDKARTETAALLSAHPELKLVMAICSPGVPGAAAAVKQAGKAGKVKVIGLGLPNENKQSVHEGVTSNVILWSTQDLGSLALRAAVGLVKGNLKAGDKTFSAGSLGTFQIQGDQIYLGKLVIFDKNNIDRYNF